MKKTSIIFLLLTILLIVASCQPVDVTPSVELPLSSPVDTETPEPTETLTPLSPTPQAFIPYPTSIAFPVATPEGVFFYEYSPDENWIIFYDQICLKYHSPCLIVENIETHVRWQFDFDFERLNFSNSDFLIEYWNSEEDYFIFSMIDEPTALFAVNRFDLETGEVDEIIPSEPIKRNEVLVNQITGEIYYLVRNDYLFKIYHLDADGKHIETFIFPEFDRANRISWFVSLFDNTKFMFFIIENGAQYEKLVMIDLVTNTYSVTLELLDHPECLDIYWHSDIAIFYEEGSWIFQETRGRDPQKYIFTPDHIETYDLQIVYP